MKIHELLALRGKRMDEIESIHTKMSDIRSKKDFDAEKDGAEYAKLKGEYDAGVAAVKAIDDDIARAKELQELSAKSAQPAPGQEIRVPAAPETDRYAKEKSLLLGGIAKMFGAGGGNIYNARQAASDVYGENHPVTKALVTSTGAAGGFIVPPDVMNEIIPLLRAQAVVRSAEPRVLPMPRGTMTLPGQASAATASYGSENKAITKSEPTFNRIVATYKKLTALVPVSNDMMRFADPAVDAVVRDDLVRVMALREDLAFLLGDGTADTPRGFLSFANGWVGAKGGTIGVWSTSGNSTLAVNGADPANSTGGNFITANQTPTLATVQAELAGAVNRLDTANVPETRRVWFFHPRTYNYLFNAVNSLGLYVFRDELMSGKLLGYPFKKTTQIATNYWNADGTNKDLSFIFLVEMSESMIFDSMQMEIAVSREGTYVDENGATISAFQQDQTIIRAISEHDHQLRHDASVAVIQSVRWAPSIS